MYWESRAGGRRSLADGWLAAWLAFPQRPTVQCWVCRRGRRAGTVCSGSHFVQPLQPGVLLPAGPHLRHALLHHLACLPACLLVSTVRVFGQA